MVKVIQSHLEHNPLGVFSFFILGILTIVIIQNIFFYLYYKDKAYFWYALYALFIFIDQLLIHYLAYSRDVLHKNVYKLGVFHTAFEWLYNSAYLIFVIEFGGLQMLRLGTAKIVKRIVYALAVILQFLVITDYILQINLVRYGFLYLQVPMLIILSIIIYKHLFQMTTLVKYYIIPGSFAFTIFSILALTTGIFQFGSKELSWSFFYIGVFVENIFFSLGLVVKQKLVIKERNQSQKQLIIKLQENQKLKASLTTKLQDEVNKKTNEIILLNKKAESEKIKQIQIEFDKEIAEMKISTLQSQMNPHFIFNTLNSIKLYIIKNNKEKAVFYLNKFSKLIRKILSSSRKKEVSLLEEIETIELYANIENIRFKNEINIQINIDENLNLSAIKIPPLILQPFIENAIWHGLAPKKNDKSLVVNILKKNSFYILIEIIDNGIGRKESNKIKENKLHKKESLGLRLTEERLKIFTKGFNNKYHLFFTDLIASNNQTRGTKVSIELPLY